jgi:hypothetical protein
MLTDTEQTANNLAPLGGVQEPATEGPEETQVAGIVGKSASAIGNAIVPPAARDKMSQGIIKSIMGDIGGYLWLLLPALWLKPEGHLLSRLHAQHDRPPFLWEFPILFVVDLWEFGILKDHWKPVFGFQYWLRGRATGVTCTWIMLA